jgi:hypothetical protein
METDIWPKPENRVDVCGGLPRPNWTQPRTTAGRSGRFALPFRKPGRIGDNSQRPDAMTLLIERELPALAHHQHIAKL